MTALRICAWDEREIPSAARADSIYCSKRCRQAAHRFRARRAPRPQATDQPLHLAYADPPYPGLSAKYYADHPDFAGEVDHDELLERLVGYPDGWALSTSAAALPWLLRRPAMPDDVRVAVWVRGSRPTRSSWPLSAYEPVVYRGGRQQAPEQGPTEREDVLTYAARARTTDPRRVTGAKPAAFIWWLFDLLGAQRGDQLDDLFPGSGGVGRAWTILQEGPPQPARPQLEIPIAAA